MQQQPSAVCSVRLMSDDRVVKEALTKHYNELTKEIGNGHIRPTTSKDCGEDPLKISQAFGDLLLGVVYSDPKSEGCKHDHQSHCQTQANSLSVASRASVLA